MDLLMQFHHLVWDSSPDAKLYFIGTVVFFATFSHMGQKNYYKYRYWDLARQLKRYKSRTK